MNEVKDLNEVQNQEKEEKGASMVEYALLAALIAIICIGGLRFLGTAISTQFSTVGSAISGG